MKINPEDFRVQEGGRVKLKKWPTLVKPAYQSKEQYQKLLAEHVAQLSALQQLQYAANSYAVLLIFQAMDAAGKDGAIKHVMSGVNPQGCQVFSFKHPSAAELENDFLWRTTRCLPERGRIGIFNRSYYEEVLIVRVHPELLRSEDLPGDEHDEKTVWKDRYRSIVQLEDHLTRNGTRIIKFFLHLSWDGKALCPYLQSSKEASSMPVRQREQHRTQRIGWLRAAVLGANDGIGSTASLVLGVASAHATHGSILVAGVAGLVGGHDEKKAGHRDGPYS